MYNIGFKPVFVNKIERENFINSQPDLFPTFDEWYWDNVKRHNTMIEKMKLYVNNNWMKLTHSDWNEVKFIVNKTQYGFKFNNGKCDDSKGYKSDVIDRLFKKFDKNVVEITMINFVYDHSDSDLSVSINDKDNWKFLSDSEINEIALHIERKLNIV